MAALFGGASLVSTRRRRRKNPAVALQITARVAAQQLDEGQSWARAAAACSAVPQATVVADLGAAASRRLGDRDPRPAGA